MLPQFSCILITKAVYAFQVIVVNRYVGKTQTLAILLLGENEEFLRKEGFTEDEIAEAKKLLFAIGLRFGVCPQCKKPSWLHRATIAEKHGKRRFTKRQYELCGSCLSPTLVHARKRRWKIKGEGKWGNDMEWPPE